ncbi:CDP-alcohol phosphatidyltransferase family protein [Blastococcus sp. SYSU D00813]
MLSIVFAWLASIAALLLMSVDAPLAAGVTFFVLAHLAFAFDCLDGRLARLTGKASPAGAGVDALADVLAWAGVAALVSTQVVGVPHDELVTGLAVLGLVAKAAAPLWTVADRLAVTLGGSEATGELGDESSAVKRLLMLVKHLSDHALVLTLIAAALAVDEAWAWITLAVVLAGVGLVVNAIALAALVRLDLRGRVDA